MSNVYEDVHLSDVGTIFRITIQDAGVTTDVSSATTKEIRFYKPDTGLVTKSAVFTTDGTDGQIEYVAEVGFIDELGTWKVQGYIQLPTGQWGTSDGEFKVVRNLTDLP